MTIGGKIKEILIERNMTIKELSNVTKMPYSTLQAIISNGRTPRADTLEKIANCLEIPISALLPDSESNSAIIKLFPDIDMDTYISAAQYQHEAMLAIVKNLIKSSDISEIELISDTMPIVSDYLLLNDAGKNLAEKILHNLTEISYLLESGEQHENT